MRDAAFRPCILIPTFDNKDTIVDVVNQVRQYLSSIIVVDDGSGPPTREIVAKLADDGVIIACHRPLNGGKGAAVRTGLILAEERGFTHALQIDGDGQHDIRRVPDFLRHAAVEPNALILGYPHYGQDVPQARLIGRTITAFWVGIEVGRGIIADAMIGFRVYPIVDALRCGAREQRMGFDIEIAVRMAWLGLPVINLPVDVRYLPLEHGGVSHFRLVRDNISISWLHTRLVTIAFFRRIWSFLRWRR